MVKIKITLGEFLIKEITFTVLVTKMKQAIRRASHQKPPQIADFSERKSSLMYPGSR